MNTLNSCSATTVGFLENSLRHTLHIWLSRRSQISIDTLTHNPNIDSPNNERLYKKGMASRLYMGPNMEICVDSRISFNMRYLLSFQ